MHSYNTGTQQIHLIPFVRSCSLRPHYLIWLDRLDIGSLFHRAYCIGWELNTGVYQLSTI
jgi:hypothetical protein